MARPTIDNLRSLGDFPTCVNWNLNVTFPTLAGTSTNAVDFNYRAESSDVPKNNQSSNEVWVRGHRVRMPGVWTSQGTFQVQVLETINNTVSTLIQTWRNATWDPQTGVSNPKANLEATVQLQRLDRQDNAIWQYNLIGAYLEDYDPMGGQLNGQSADIIRPTIIFSYDYFTESNVINS